MNGGSPGYVLLEDGSRYEGLLCGPGTSGTGEMVFTTGMTGYQEAVTDPSYLGQILCFTAPMIGN
ncbi:MAG: carbamoyl-phosphate synthase domain-containing protein, partial [Acidobacteriota bacterium]